MSSDAPPDSKRLALLQQWTATLVAVFALAVSIWSASQTFFVLREGQVIASIASACSDHIYISSRLNRRLTGATSRFHSARREEGLKVVLDASERDSASMFDIFNERADPTFNQIVLFADEANIDMLRSQFASYRANFYALQAINGQFLISARELAEGGPIDVTALPAFGALDGPIDRASEGLHEYLVHITRYCRSRVAP